MSGIVQKVLSGHDDEGKRYSVLCLYQYNAFILTPRLVQVQHSPELAMILGEIVI